MFFCSPCAVKAIARTTNIARRMRITVRRARLPRLANGQGNVRKWSGALPIAERWPRLPGMSRDGARMSVVIALLVATLAVTAWMALRAQYAAKAHRAAAEDVVRDWTRVAADELARRAENQASYYGMSRLLQTIADAPRLPSAEELLHAARADRTTQRASRLANVSV